VRCVLFAITAIAATIAPARAQFESRVDWPMLGNASFRATIDKLVGPDAVDCGVYALTVVDKPRRADRRRVSTCIADASRRGVPFKYATRRIPIDSMADEVYLRSTSGEMWVLVFDLMLGDPSIQIWYNKCALVSVDSKTLIIFGEKCEERAP
jgi:hypothetical protein